MPHNRYFVDEFFQENAAVLLSGDEYHHLARVSRGKLGDFAELVNGRGQMADATVARLNKHEAELQIRRVIETPRQKAPLILAQALTRMNHLEWIIEKGTELDASAFWLFPGIHSEKESLSEPQAQRLKNLAISAMKQCGRLDLPAIVMKPPLLQWLPLDGTLLYGSTSDKAPYLWDLALEKPLPSPVILFIGTESGFDPKETHFLEGALKAKGIRLHSNILRAETAALTALSLIQSHL
jgi:16S rRNA (uracil1498-N3)-methyltransferase